MLLLAAWLTYLGGERFPKSGVVAVLVSAVVMLSVWSPPVACLVGLGIALAVRGFCNIRRNIVAIVVIAIAAVVLVVAAAIFVLPGLSSSSALGGDGGFLATGPTSIFVVVAFTAPLTRSVERITPRWVR